MNQAREHAALGGVLGALGGDAAGAVLELFGRPIADVDVAQAMTLPGGGTWGVPLGHRLRDDRNRARALYAVEGQRESHARHSDCSLGRRSRPIGGRRSDDARRTANGATTRKTMEGKRPMVLRVLGDNDGAWRGTLRNGRFPIVPRHRRR